MDGCGHDRVPHSFPTRRSSDLRAERGTERELSAAVHSAGEQKVGDVDARDHQHEDHRAQYGEQRGAYALRERSEEHTSELQSQSNLVCRLLLEKKKYTDADQAR